MKKLILPLGALFFFAAACTKDDMPLPGAGNASTEQTITIRQSSAERVVGDTLIKITRRPDEKGPVPNEKQPVIKK